jgi:salicylate hydroxylase
VLATPERETAHCDNGSRTEESWPRECDPSEALENYAGWHKSLLRLFAASLRHYKCALFDVTRCRRGLLAVVTLLGDAAHAMLPYLGQGAAQAIEDGCVLARALSVLPDDLSVALQLYERSRLARTTRVVLGARGTGDETPSRWAALKRDVSIALRSRFGSDREIWSGRDGELPPHPPVRTGHAQLTHPAPQSTSVVRAGG